MDLSGLTADQQFQAGLVCNGQRATPTSALPTSCPGSQFSSSLVKIPAPGTENDDKNPPRIAPRHLFDLAIGDDNLFRGDKYKVSLQAYGHQSDEQVRSLQLSFHVQRHALSDTAHVDGGDWHFTF